jgi:agmatinase
MPELAVEETLFGISRSSAPRAVIIGAPLDRSSGCRPGGGNGPAAVREASRSLESYSIALQRDLADIELTDVGDLDVSGSLSDALDAVEDAVADATALPVLLGGEHTVSLAAVRALRRRHPSLMLLHVDAHTDLRSSYDGELVSRATWIVHSGIALDRVVQLGIRSTTGDVAVRPLHMTDSLELPPQLLAGAPVYVSIDIDVLDPSAAPGVRCPEPGGVWFRELESLVHGLAGLNVVGVDVVEVAPDTDPAGLTALAAAKLLRELLLVVA